MTTPPSCPVQHGSPIDTEGPRVSIYSEEFAADPHLAYREMRRQYGSLVPVNLAPDVPATLVIGYHTALRILNDPDHFPADPRTWQKNVPGECPILPMLEWRPNALRSAGLEHLRYRQANLAAVADVDLHTLHATVERIAIPLINAFCQDGAADLISQYAFPLTFAVLNATLGCPPEIGQQVATGMAAIFEGVNADKGNAMLTDALFDLVTLKRKEPGDDITSRLLAHPAKLDDVEMIHQLVTLYGAGIEPQQNLIVNTLLLMLTDDRFAGNVLGGSLSTRDALDEVLFTDPPMANYCVSYPKQPILIDGVWLPAHQPVVISMSGCNNDPTISVGEYVDNRSHLAWSVGPHACPARSMAYLIVQDAIDQLLDALPELDLAVPAHELSWRPGPFHRALVSLPVVFPKSPPLNVF
ncbi:cytochrome P450 [Nocardia brasiliensis]|uniref:Cytochrome P450 monooxygenase n=1 Tax=Nocardia brasiliensis (strain ATCC 700358 / HUJEG-1) TaxID=1133849 RepID=K0F0N2_NOCB7|nr:Cytochrome P450 monooxygenase [Nocardia brasiliensis ATCC 700358]OCF86584.1 cytochrome [Nocardia brasiliensis]